MVSNNTTYYLDSTRIWVLRVLQYYCNNDNKEIYCRSDMNNRRFEVNREFCGHYYNSFILALFVLNIEIEVSYVIE